MRPVRTIRRRRCAMHQIVGVVPATRRPRQLLLSNAADPVVGARYCSFVTGTRSGAPATNELPLQWPLVGRHEQLDLFAATLADPRAHGFVISGAAGGGETPLGDPSLGEGPAAGAE